MSLIEARRLFHWFGPLKQKLLCANCSSVFGIIILQFLLSLLTISARYSGWPQLLILKTSRINHPTWSKIWFLCALRGAWHSILAALFCRTWISLIGPLSVPPNKGRQCAVENSFCDGFPHFVRADVLQMSLALSFERRLSTCFFHFKFVCT